LLKTVELGGIIINATDVLDFVNST